MEPSGISRGLFLYRILRYRAQTCAGLRGIFWKECEALSFMAREASGIYGENIYFEKQAVFICDGIFRRYVCDGSGAGSQQAAGAVYGGRSADKNPSPDRLYGRILVAAVWIAAIPVLGKYVVLGISAVVIFAVDTNFLVWAAFAACMVIFVFPLFLLGTVTPSLAKYSVDSLEDSGRTVGTLGAFNTIGSIIGTFVPTFVTIPAVGTSITFLLFAGILLLLGVLYFASRRKGVVKSAVAAALFMVCCILGRSNSFAFWEQGLAYEGESVYNYLQVKEDSNRVILSTNVLFGVQSVLMKETGLTGMYYDYAADCEMLI